MKTNNVRYIAFFILFIVFILIRVYYIASSNSVDSLAFKTLAISNSSFPFGIIKNTVLLDTNSFTFYFIAHFLLLFTKNALIVRIFNTILALICVFVFVLIGKNLKGLKLGIFLGFFVCINHFFILYTDMISPYCLTFLVSTVLIKYLLDFLRKPDNNNYLKLNILNCALIVVDSLGFIYVASECLILYLYFSKKKIFKEKTLKLAFSAFICFLAVFSFLIIQYTIYSKFLIPNAQSSIGFSFSGLYLLINEFISPYLSFTDSTTQTKSTLGLIYSLFGGSKINNLKIAITLFYGSILPLLLIFIMAFKAFFKDYKLKMLFLISLADFSVIILISIFEMIDLNPIYLIQFFITIIILLGCGIFSLKDDFLRYLIIFSLIAIQFINPEVSSFDASIQKREAVLNPVEIFFKDYQINNKDLIIMPYMGEYGALYFNKLHFLNFSYTMLQKKSKDKIIKNLSSKKTKTINKNNIHYLLEDYLNETYINPYLAKYFVENVIEQKPAPDRIVLIIDKLNSKPISTKSILKCANSGNYNSKLKKIDFRDINLEQSKSGVFLDALKSKTLYNFIDLLNANYFLSSIVEYKKIDNEYYKLKTELKSIPKALSSFESDYVFLIYAD